MTFSIQSCDLTTPPSWPWRRRLGWAGTEALWGRVTWSRGGLARDLGLRSGPGPSELPSAAPRAARPPTRAQKVGRTPGSPPHPEPPVGHCPSALGPRVTGTQRKLWWLESRTVWGQRLHWWAHGSQAPKHGRPEETIHARNFQRICSLYVLSVSRGHRGGDGAGGQRCEL